VDGEACDRRSQAPRICGSCRVPRPRAQAGAREAPPGRKALRAVIDYRTTNVPAGLRPEYRRAYVRMVYGPWWSWTRWFKRPRKAYLEQVERCRIRPDSVRVFVSASPVVVRWEGRGQ